MRVTASSGIALFAILGFVGCAGSNTASTETGGGRQTAVQRPFKKTFCRPMKIKSHSPLAVLLVELFSLSSIGNGGEGDP